LSIRRAKEGLIETTNAEPKRRCSPLNDQNRMLDELLGINPTTVVVMKDSNPVLMPWIDEAPAVWRPGTRAPRRGMSSPTCCSGS
jgi:hypothetical protein